jgi:hypothetical protein
VERDRFVIVGALALAAAPADRLRRCFGHAVR